MPRLMAANVDANDDVILKANNSDNVTLTTKLIVPLDTSIFAVNETLKSTL